MKLDEIDMKILRALQTDGRLSNQDLADAISLSPSACHRRVKELEKIGVIQGYRAELDIKKLGYNIEAFVEVVLTRLDRVGHENFKKEIAMLSEIENAYIITGESNYLLHVRAANFEEFSLFIENKLNQIEGITKIHSKIVMSEMKQLGRFHI